MSLVAVVAFVIASPAEAQKNSAEAPDTENALYDLSKVSFLGIHTVQLPGDDQRPESLDSYGQFTIQGPRVETMRPILAKNGGVAMHSNSDLFLYGEYGEAHVDLTSKTWTRLDKQSVGRQPHGGTTTAMALDTRRNCLLISRDNHLHAYDPQATRWLWRKEHKAPFLGLAYDPNRDLFYGVVGENLDPRERFLRERMMGNPAVGGREFAINSPLKIRHITPEGESHVEVTVQKPLPPKPIAYNFQTTFSQGVLILVTDHSLFAIDPMNGAFVYRGETTLHRNGKIWSDGTTAPHMPSIGERRDRLQERLKAVTPRLDKVRAASLKAELNCLTQCMRGDCVMERIAGKAEVHAVGMYTVHEPSMNGELICPVTVSHTAAPIILVLSAHETLTWKIKGNPTVRIEQVVLAGWNKQDVEGVPENTPVIDRTGKTHPEHYLYAAPTGRTAGARDGFGGSVHAVFGAEPMTMQFQYNGPSYQIGGESDAWSSQYIESLARNLERDLFVAENEDLAFTAIFRHGKPSNRQSLLTSFSLTGPKEQNVKPLREPVMLSISGRQADERFVVDRDNQISALENGQLTSLESPEKEVPGRTTAVVYDRKRERLMAWHSRESRKQGITINGRVVIEHDLRAGRWRQIGSVGADIGAVVHHEEKDLLYGLVLPLRSGAIRNLVIMNPHGAILGSVPLSQPFYWDLEAGPPQAVFERGHLIVINSPQAVLLPDGKERLVAQVIAIDPTNGQTFFTGRYFCD